MKDGSGIFLYIDRWIDIDRVSKKLEGAMYILYMHLNFLKNPQWL